MNALNNLSKETLIDLKDTLRDCVRKMLNFKQVSNDTALVFMNDIDRIPAADLDKVFQSNKDEIYEMIKLLVFIPSPPATVVQSLLFHTGSEIRALVPSSHQHLMGFVTPVSVGMSEFSALEALTQMQLSSEFPKELNQAVRTTVNSAMFKKVTYGFSPLVLQFTYSGGSITATIINGSGNLETVVVDNITINKLVKDYINSIFAVNSLFYTFSGVREFKNTHESNVESLMAKIVSHVVTSGRFTHLDQIYTAHTSNANLFYKLSQFGYIDFEKASHIIQQVQSGFLINSIMGAVVASYIATIMVLNEKEKQETKPAPTTAIKSSKPKALVRKARR